MPFPEKRRLWVLPDLIDFEFFLRADADRTAEELRVRDREFVGDDEIPVDAGPEIRSRALRGWLERRRTKLLEKTGAEYSMLPGFLFDHARRIVGAALAIGAAVAGAALAFGLLNYEARYFNVLLFLAVTLLPQLLLLALLVGGWLFRRAIGRSETLGFIQTLARTAVDWLSQKSWVSRFGEPMRGSWKGLLRRDYLGWPIAGITQMAGVNYNIGILAGFVGCLAVLDVRFFWESTPALAASESLRGVVTILAAPWSWALPDLVPTMEQIQGTKIELTGGEQGLDEKVDSAAAWAPFLITTIVTWGLLPRFLLRLATDWMGRKAVRDFSFNERPHRELWRRLTEFQAIETDIEGPGDDAVVILWGGISPEAGDLRKASLQQLRLDPVESIAAGGIDPSGDEIAVGEVSARLREAESLSRVILLAESWGLVPRDLGPFLKSVRDEIGEDRPIIAFLVGHPGKDTLFTAPKPEEVSVWEEFAAELDDPNLTIRPFRAKEIAPTTGEN